MGVLLLLAVVLALGVGGRLEASSEVSPRGFMDHLMSMNGCRRFAGLVNATANATGIFECSSLVHGGLVVFCPDDNAVAAFEPSFNKLCADGQLALLRYHVVAPGSLGDRRPLIVSTLASDLAWGYGFTIRHRGDAMELLTSSGGVARVTRMVTGEDEALVVYLIDTVMLPRESIDCGISSFDEGLPWLDFLARTIAYILIVLAEVVVVMAVLLLGGAIRLQMKTRAVSSLPSSV